MKIVFKSVQDENYNYYWTKSKFYTGADFLGGGGCRGVRKHLLFGNHVSLLLPRKTFIKTF